MSIDTWIRIWRAGFVVAFLGATQFVVLFLVAAIYYPGGNTTDRFEVGYSSVRNYVSDVGRTLSVSGRSNDTASRLFNGSLTALAVSLVPYFLFMPMQAWDRSGWLTLAAFLGAGACVSLLVMAFHPSDLYPARHHFAMFAFLILVFGSASLHAGAMLTSSENTTLVLPLVSVGVAMLAMAFGIGATGSILSHLGGEAADDRSPVLLEKLFFIAVLIWVFTFSARMILVTDFSEFRDRRTIEGAEDYLREIGLSGGRKQ